MATYRLAFKSSRAKNDPGDAELALDLLIRQTALRSLAFKWIRIVYRCWKTQTHYDELLYLKALKQRGSTLLNQISLPKSC